VQAIMAEERGMAEQALRAGRNPYELVYEFAKLTGYKPAAAASAAPPAAPPAAAPAQPAGKVMPPDMTLSKTGGNTSGQEELDTSDDDGILSAAFDERFPGRRRA
jgi:hypothetical protein